MGESGVNRSAAYFHGGERVQYFDSTLKRLKVWVLVRKHAESPLGDTEANAGMNVLLCGLEPSITGSLWD